MSPPDRTPAAQGRYRDTACGYTTNLNFKPADFLHVRAGGHTAYCGTR